MLRRREIVQDWTRVDHCEVASSEFRSFEYHVVLDPESGRVTLTIKCIDDGTAAVRRLDPNDLGRADRSADYAAIAARRVRQLYRRGMI